MSDEELEEISDILNFDKTNYNIQQAINGFVEENVKNVIMKRCFIINILINIKRH